MTRDELQSILERHRRWLAGGEGGERANLREADLREAYLREDDLYGADLNGAEADYVREAVRTRHDVNLSVV